MVPTLSEGFLAMSSTLLPPTNYYLLTTIGVS